MDRLALHSELSEQDMELLMEELRRSAASTLVKLLAAQDSKEIAAKGGEVPMLQHLLNEQNNQKSA
jgi:hypothetical protein